MDVAHLHLTEASQTGPQPVALQSLQFRLQFLQLLFVSYALSFPSAHFFSQSFLFFLLGKSPRLTVSIFSLQLFLQVADRLLVLFGLFPHLLLL